MTGIMFLSQNIMAEQVLSITTTREKANLETLGEILADLTDEEQSSPSEIFIIILCN